MMKLKNLIVNTDNIALEALKLWDYDEETLKFWRGSSNIIYHFKFKGEGYYLRLSYEEENSLEQISAELDFLLYLDENNYPCNRPLKSSRGKYIEVINTNRGIYYAVVFNQVKETPLNINTMTQADFKGWGKSLAKLHQLSRSFEPKLEIRENWKDKITFIRKVLCDLQGEQLALKELDRVDKWLSSLIVNKENYGLIHYDFVADNVFWDGKSQKFNIIDFDDSMYHWYVMDIIRSLEEIKELEEGRGNIAISSFIEGYQSSKEIQRNLIEQMSSFERFSDLYTFARLQRTLKDRDFQEEPEWVDFVRNKLMNKCNELRKKFQKGIDNNRVDYNIS